MDERNKVLAKNLVNYSIGLQKGEKVLIDVKGLASMELVQLIIREVYSVGAIPFLNISDYKLDRELLLDATADQYKFIGEVAVKQMKGMNAYIGVTSNENSSELSDVPVDKLSIWTTYFVKPVHFDNRVPHTKWVVLRYPTMAMAQAANMSYEAFLTYYYNVCNLDYSKMSVAMDSLVTLMDKTDKVKILGEDTNLTFSIKDIKAIKCAGSNNIPDGEVYTAPVKNSINGHITYNTPAEYQGFTYEKIHLEFKDGKIINSTANDTERITKVFDTDEGARYVGEFAIGVNPYITKPMKNTLFDEKIMGSFHFTPGACYDEAPNGNTSAIHWDLVCIQTNEYGGGEIYFDDVLIRKDGYFLLEELKCLNPENLL